MLTPSRLSTEVNPGTSQLRWFSPLLRRVHLRSIRPRWMVALAPRWRAADGNQMTPEDFITIDALVRPIRPHDLGAERRGLTGPRARASVAAGRTRADRCRRRRTRTTRWDCRGH